MASTEVLIRYSPGPARARVRSPVWTVVFAVITLGIYVPFWWYFVNREMRDLGRARGSHELGDSPGTSVLAVTLGALIIVPAIISIINTCKRTQAAQRLAGRTDLLNGWIALVLFVLVAFVGIPFWIGYMQSELNKVWQTEGIADPIAPAIPQAVMTPAGIAPAAGGPPPTAQMAPTPPAAETQAAPQSSPADLPPPTGEPLASPPPATQAAATQPTAESAQPAPPLQQMQPQAAPEPAPPLQAPAPPAAPQIPPTPADWYPDPWGQARLRYWDGQSWTGHVAQ